MIPSGMLHSIKLGRQLFFRIQRFQSQPFDGGIIIISFEFISSDLQLVFMWLSSHARRPLLGHASQQKYYTGR